MRRAIFLMLFTIVCLKTVEAAVPRATTPGRIITLNGALTETVDALGLGKNIVAVDVTSTYPAYAARLPKVSKNRSVSAEGLLAFRPDVVLSPAGSLSKEIEFQLKAAGIKVVNIRQNFSVAGTSQFIKEVSNALGVPQKGAAVARATEMKVSKALNMVKQSKKTVKVLFIYARGTGVMMVAGRNTSVDAIINLAGGTNAASSFDDFKPYTTEALVEANPDVILMFDFGFSSLGGTESILKIPGMLQTKAGKNKKIIEMDSGLLINFSTRLDQAVSQLNSKL